MPKSCRRVFSSFRDPIAGLARTASFPPRMESPGGSTPTLAPTRSSSSFDMHAGAKPSAQELSGEDGMEKAEKAGSASHEEPEYLWVDWAVHDPENPRHWPTSRKWMMACVGITFCALVSICVSGYSISQGSVVTQLNVTRPVLATLGITMFTITFGAAPLLLAPLSELYGRSSIYIISAAGYTLFFIPQALATNIETILVSRFISGIFGSTAVSLVGGTLSDVFDNQERAPAMSLFAFAAFAATGLGPVMFGYMEQNYVQGFRYISWIIFACSAIFTLVIIFGMKESRGSVLLRRRAKKLRETTGDQRWRSRDEVEAAKITFWQLMRQNLSRPVRMLFTEPVLASFAIWISFCWACLYIALEGIPIVFSVYGFTIGQSGMVFAAQIMGSFLALGVDYGCQKLYAKHFPTYRIEARLFTAMAGGILTPVGCWIYAWTAFAYVPWILPAIGMTLLYAGLLLVYLSCFTYLADSYGLFASSALSAQSFLRNVVGSVFPLFTPAMYSKLGIQGAGSLTAGLATLLAFTPFILFRYGAVLRARSPFAKEMERREDAEEKRQL